MLKIKRDDEVIVIAGRDKGKRGKVVRVLADRVIVSGINLIKKHRFIHRMLQYTTQQPSRLIVLDSRFSKMATKCAFSNPVARP